MASVFSLWSWLRSSLAYFLIGVGLSVVLGGLAPVAAQTITEIEPKSGAAGATVKIYGSNLGGLSANSVTIGGNPVSSLTEVRSTLIEVEVPSGIGGGPQSVAVNGTAAADRFSVVTGGAGGFVDANAGFTPVKNGSASAWGDYDGDGDLDLAVIGNQGLDAGASEQFTIEIYRNEVASGNGFVEAFSEADPGITPLDRGSVDWGDFDGDGDLDLVVTGVDNFTNPRTIIYENDVENNGGFNELSAGLTGVEEGKAQWGDYDGDGDLDLVVVGGNGGSPTAAIYENQVDSGNGFVLLNGDGNGNTQSLTPVYRGASAAWGDFDQDGDLDLVVAGESSGGTKVVSVYENDVSGGNGFINQGSQGLTAVNRVSIDVADFNGDGYPDLAVTGADAAGNSLSKVYTNDSSTDFQDTNDIFFNLDKGIADVDNGDVEWGDFDADGDPDLALTGFNSGGGGQTTRIYENEGGGSFSSIGAGLTQVSDGSVSWGDYDGNGRLDLLVTGAQAGGEETATLYQAQSFRLDNTTPAANATNIPVGDPLSFTFSAPVAVSSSLADSIVVRGAQSGPVDGTVTGTTTLTYSPDQSFAPGEQVTVSVLGGIESVLGARLDTTGTFQFTAAASSGPAAFPLQQTVSTSEDGARTVAVGDLDGDGNRDLVVGSDRAQTVTRYMNQGNGTFGGGTVVAGDLNVNHARDVILADLDGQNGPDIVVAEGQGASGSVDAISWYSNDGNGSFSGPNYVATEGSTVDDPRSLAAGDLDGDGDIDVVAAGSDGSTIHRYDNDGNGNFAHSTITGAPSDPRDVALGDINENGNLDLIWTDTGNSGEAQWQPNIDGSFDAPTALGGTHANPVDVELADVDGNGSLDAVVAAAGDNEVKVIFDDGAAGFVGTGQVLSPSVDSVSAVHVADFEGGDGELDILAAAGQGNSLYAFVNTGGGGFSSEGAFETSVAEPHDIVAADVDGDGRLDPVALSYADDTVAFYPNIPDQPVIYVDDDATGGLNYGASWDTALPSLQTAFDVAESGDEIRIAAGVYRPASPNDSLAFSGAKDGIKILGGYEDSGSNRSRDPDTYSSVLSGDVDTNDDPIQPDTDNDNDANTSEPVDHINGDNSNHVLYLDATTGGDITPSTVIDGVIVEGGWADADPMGRIGRTGGGMVCDGSEGNACSPTIRNVIFRGNGAATGGGALSNFGENGTASPRIVNVTFYANGGTTSNATGGAMYNWGFGGEASPVILNSRFERNASNGGGGAIFSYGVGGAASALIANTVVWKNESYGDGGALHNQEASPKITNATFWGNSAYNSSGGAIYNRSGATPQVENSILWRNVSGNISSPTSNQIANDGSGTTLTVAHSILEGGVGAINNSNGASTSDNGGNLDADPLFIDAANPNLRLNWASPAIDAGDPSLLPSDLADLDGNEDTSENLPLDLSGADREQGNSVDIGAYEGGAAPSGGTVYVDADEANNAADTTDHGGSWNKPYHTLQAALAAARHTAATTTTGDDLLDVRVAQGVYYPDDGPGISEDNRDTSFVLEAPNLEVRGGFANGDVPSERDPEAKPTVLSGDIDADAGGADATDGDGIVPTPNGIDGNNSYHVVESRLPTGMGATLDGVVVTGGDANSSSFPNNSGGGLWVESFSSSPRVIEVTFSGNRAGQNGGGMYLADVGATVINSVFGANWADTGGAIYRQGDLDYSLSIVNGLFSGNQASGDGGAIYLDGTASRLVNLTFSNNVAGSGAGGALAKVGSNEPVLSNSIFWGNTANGTPDQLFVGSSASISVDTSIVEGGASSIGPGTANTSKILNQDPRFANAAGPDGTAGTADDSLQVLGNSPALGIGGSTQLPPDGADLDGDEDTSEPIPVDLAGGDRQLAGFNGKLDAGAYEGAVSPSTQVGVPSPVQDSSADLNGAVVPYAPSAEAVFEVEPSAGGSVTRVTAGTDFSGNTSSLLSGSVSGLLPGTQYDVRVVADDGTRSTTSAPETFSTDASLPTATADPASAITTAQATLNGTVNPGGAAVNTIEAVFGRASGSNTTLLSMGSLTSNLTQDASVSTTTSELLPSTEYEYFVRATNATGTVESDPITFTTNNVAPSASDDNATTDEDTDVVVDVLANDTDVGQSGLGGSLVPASVTVTSGPSIGETSINTSTGAITYSPAEDENGSDSFTYTVEDDSGTVSNEATVSLTINAVNDAPSIASISDQSISEDDAFGPFDLSISDPESSIEDLALTATSNNQDLLPDGNLTLSTTEDPPTLTATPVADSNGTATITLSASDGDNETTESFVLTVDAVNDAPTIGSIEDRTIDEDGELTNVSVPIGDTETTVENLTLTGTSQNPDLVPDDSITARTDTEGGTFSLAPTADSNGTAVIDLTVSDGTDQTTTSFTLTVTPVEDPPVVATNEGLTLEEDTQATIGQGILRGNDPDSDDPSTVQFTVETVPSNGALRLNGSPLSSGETFTQADVNNGALSYAHDGSETTSDGFDFTVVDAGGLSVSGTFAITVTPVNDVPTISALSDQTIEEDGTTGPITFTIDDAETAVSDLTVSARAGDPGLVPDDNLTIGGSGADRTIEAVPAADSNGTTSITVSVDDGTDVGTESFALTVTAVNDTPRVATNAGLTLDEGTRTALSSSMLEGRDVEDGAGALTFTLDTVPANGSLLLNGTALSQGGTFTQADVENGAVSYRHDGSETTSDSFSFRLADGAGVSVGPTTFSITVQPVNDAPEATADTDSTPEDTDISIPVLENDSDAEAELDTSSVSVVQAPSFGTTSVNTATGVITYVPAPDSNGTIGFTYRIADVDDAADTAAVTINVKSINDPPVAKADTAQLLEGGTTAVDVLANDSDVENQLDPRSVSIVEAPSHGTVTDVTDGTITYAPATGYNGSDRVVYSVADDSNATDTAPVHLQVIDVTLASVQDTHRVGYAQVGQPGDTARVQLENRGEASLSELEATVQGAAAEDYQVIGGIPSDLAPSEEATARIAFRPSTTGQRSATLSVTSAEGGSAEAELVGRGISVAAGADAPPMRNEPATIELLVDGGYEPGRDSLYVRPGGAQAYRGRSLQSSSTESGLRLRAELSRDLVTSRGIDYYAILRPERGAAQPTQVLTVPEGGRLAAQSDPRHLPVSFAEWSAPFQLAPKNYRMVSIPAEPANGIRASLEAAYGPYDRSDWRLTRWDPAANNGGTYREYPELDSLRPGQGMWLITDEGDSLAVREGTTVEADQPRSLILLPGWNQIGSPFGFAVPWSAIEADSTEIGEPVAYRDDGGYRYGEARLRPWEGYFVHNRTQTPDTLEIPPVGVGAKGARQKTTRSEGPDALAGTGPLGAPARGADTEDGGLEGSVPGKAQRADYTLRVAAWPTGSSAGRPHRVWLGFRSRARAGLDALDFAQAPPIGRSVQLSVMEGGADANTQAERYAGSFKPAEGAGQRWRLAVTNRSTDSKQAVQLRVTSQGSPPEGQRRYLLDLKRERRMVSGREMVLDPGETRALRVVVGTEAYAEQNSDGISVEEFTNELRGNYPNPFRGKTTIEYVLAEEQEVTIEVYNILGQRVRTLVRGTEKAGLHTLTWRGENRYGTPVGSGVYFYRIEAEDFTETRKMVLVR